MSRLTRLLRGNEQERYGVARRLARTIAPSYRFSTWGRTCLEDREFWEWFDGPMRDKTDAGSWDRKYTVRSLLPLTKGLKGDTAECGSYLGATSHLICSFGAPLGIRHHVFDSFAGLSTPDDNDGASTKEWKPGALTAPENEVRALLAEFSDVHFYRGWIPDRFDEVADRQFRFVHVDVDLFQPTMASFEFFYPRMVPGGVIVCDDYGFSTCPGATRAVDEFMAGRPEPVVHLPTGQGLVIRSAGG